MEDTIYLKKNNWWAYRIILWFYIPIDEQPYPKDPWKTVRCEMQIIDWLNSHLWEWAYSILSRMPFINCKLSGSMSSQNQIQIAPKTEKNMQVVIFILSLCLDFCRYLLNFNKTTNCLKYVLQSPIMPKN